MKFLYIKLFVVFLACLHPTFGAASPSKNWSPPTVISFHGEIYKVASKSGSLADFQIYEYTSQNEDIANWTSLLSIIFQRSERLSNKTLANLYSKTALAHKPQPRLKIYEAGEALVVRVIYDRSALPMGYFESNVRKLKYSETCGGIFDISFAYKVRTNVSVDVQISENEMLVPELLRLPIAIECLTK